MHKHGRAIGQQRSNKDTLESRGSCEESSSEARFSGCVNILRVYRVRGEVFGDTESTAGSQGAAMIHS